jgi:hypothetical protein
MKSRGKAGKSGVIGILFGAIGALGFVTPAPAAAQAHHDRGHAEHRERARVERWHGDIRRFHEHDLARWHGGHWAQARHGGRFGWWWIVGPTWYFYPSPVYPYPDPYLPPAAVAAPSQYWYFCRDPQGYYPYVPQCRVAWQAVPPSPQ